MPELTDRTDRTGSTEPGRSTELATDLVFALQGDTLPIGYRLALWAALVDRLPWLATEPQAGIHPLRVPTTLDPVLLLPRRARLSLRVPRARTTDAAALGGNELIVDGNRLLLGAARERPLLAHPTIEAAFVVCDAADAEALHRRVEQLLADTAAAARSAGGTPHHICGRIKTLAIGNDTLHGASVVLHGLKPEQSLWWQSVGLGAERRFGCGLMVPHKLIAGLD